MHKYIDREAALESVCECCMESADCEKHCIKDIPAADVRPIVHGKWILHDNGSATCSVCKCWQKLTYDDDNFQHYCGNCGAQMGVEE